MRKEATRVLIAGGGTGGHLYPALNLAEALQRRSDRELEVLLVGARRGIESRVLPGTELAHALLPLEPIYRSRPWRNWRLPGSLVRAFRAVARVFDEYHPRMVLGTGGYVAAPVVAWAVWKSVPTAIQEQNSHPGLATRLLARWVDQIHLGYEEAAPLLRPGARTEVKTHGNPIRPVYQISLDPEETRRSLGLGDGPIVLVTGGSQGAASLNAAVSSCLELVARGDLPDLPAQVEILWSVGPDKYEELASTIEDIARDLRVRAVPYIDDMEAALRVSSLVVSRAGALALAEICAAARPAILVPYPHAAADHQAKNARVLEREGAAVVIDESTLTRRPERLWEETVRLMDDSAVRERMGRAAFARSKPDAADRIADDLLKLLEAA